MKSASQCDRTVEGFTFQEGKPQITYNNETNEGSKDKKKCHIRKYVPTRRYHDDDEIFSSKYYKKTQETKGKNVAHKVKTTHTLKKKGQQKG